MLAAGLTPIPFSLRTEDGKHIYTIEGIDRELESVTTNLRVINKRDLNDWRVKLGKEESNRIRDEGGDVGRMVHAAGLRLFKGVGYGSYEWSKLGLPTPEDERVRNAVYALDMMRRERNMVAAAAECFVYSLGDGGAGMLDAAIWTDEHHDAVDIFDWKTSGAVYPEAWLQLAPYARWFMECYHVPVRRIYPVRLDRGLPTVPRDADGNPIRTGLYELGATWKRHEVDPETGKPTLVERHQDYMEGDDIMDAFENYMHAQELGAWIKRHGGRY